MSHFGFRIRPFWRYLNEQFIATNIITGCSERICFNLKLRYPRKKEKNSSWFLTFSSQSWFTGVVSSAINMFRLSQITGHNQLWFQLRQAVIASLFSVKKLWNIVSLMVWYYHILYFIPIVFLEFFSYTLQCLILHWEMSKCCHKIFIVFGIQTRADKQNIFFFYSLWKVKNVTNYQNFLSINFL